MPTVTAYPTGNTAAAGFNGAWSTPNNAHDDELIEAYATCANLGRNREFATYWHGFNLSSIPAGSTINSVAVEVLHNVSTQGSVATLRASAWANHSAGSASTQIGSTFEDATEPLLDTPRTFTIPASLAQLQAAGFAVRVQSAQGNTNTGYTHSLGYVRVTVDYTEPAPAKIGTATGTTATTTMSAGAKNGRGVAATAAVYGQSTVGAKHASATGLAANTLNLSAWTAKRAVGVATAEVSSGVAASGTQAETKAGSATATAVSVVAAAGVATRTASGSAVATATTDASGGGRRSSPTELTASATTVAGGSAAKAGGGLTAADAETTASAASLRVGAANVTAAFATSASGSMSTPGAASGSATTTARTVTSGAGAASRRTAATSSTTTLASCSGVPHRRLAVNLTVACGHRSAAVAHRSGDVESTTTIHAAGSGTIPAGETAARTRVTNIEPAAAVSSVQHASACNVRVPPTKVDTRVAANTTSAKENGA